MDRPNLGGGWKNGRMNSGEGWQNGNPPTRDDASALALCAQVNTFLLRVACAPFILRPTFQELRITKTYHVHLSLQEIILKCYSPRGKPPSLAPRPKYLAPPSLPYLVELSPP